MNRAIYVRKKAYNIGIIKGFIVERNGAILLLLQSRFLEIRMATGRKSFFVGVGFHRRQKVKGGGLPVFVFQG